MTLQAQLEFSNSEVQRTLQLGQSFSLLVAQFEMTLSVVDAHRAGVWNSSVRLTP